MIRLAWFVGWAFVAVWSLACAAAYGTFNLIGGFAARNADKLSSDPLTVEWIFQVFRGIQSLSTGAVVVVWALVSLLILFVPWFLSKAAGEPRARAGSPVRPVPAGRQDGVIDLAPGEYSVGPRTEPRRRPDILGPRR